MARLLHLIGEHDQIGIAASVVTVAAALRAIHAIKSMTAAGDLWLINVALLGYAMR